MEENLFNHKGLKELWKIHIRSSPELFVNKETPQSVRIHDKTDLNNPSCRLFQDFYIVFDYPSFGGPPYTYFMKHI